MPSTPNWKSILEFGSSVTEPRVEQVRAFVANLVDAGQLGREQAASAVDEILEIGRRRADELSTVVRREVERQLRSLGVMKADDANVGDGASAKQAPAKKAAAAKAPAKKAPAAKAPAKKAAAAKAPATKAPATKTAAKKTAAKKAGSAKVATKNAATKSAAAKRATTPTAAPDPAAPTATVAQD